jgi:hypothetical protein
MASYTINRALVLGKAVRERLAELRALRNSIATTETWYQAENRRETKPNYDVKEVDKKCVELENFLLDLDSEIKQSNAINTINIDVDVKTLLTPLA